MNDLIYINNIKERLFDHFSQEEFDTHIQILIDLYLNKSKKHLWYDYKYLNSCLELFFIYFNKINNPLPLFYSIFLKNINTSLHILNLNLSKSLINQIAYLKDINEYILNDLNINENDYDILNSILYYNKEINVVITEKTQIYAGLSYETENGVSFKFKR